MLAEIGKLNGATRRLANRDELRTALADLVKTEDVKKATLWTTPIWWIGGCRVSRSARR